MAEEVTRVVEDVDRLFSEIVVNGESHTSDRYVPPKEETTPVSHAVVEENREPVTVTKTVESLDKLFSSIVVNGDEHVSERYVAPAVTTPEEEVTDSQAVVEENREPVTVTKTVENLDKLFSSIVVNGDEHVSERYTAPSVTTPEVSQQNTSTELPQQTTENARSTVGADVYAVELNNILHNFADRVLTQMLANIEALIPNQASPQNQLADKNFVNSSIATNTANFLGTYTSLADIQAIPNPTNNDYAYLETTDQAGNTLYDRYKYSGEDDEWLFEYELNNSSFTAEQWATINSGLTQQSVESEVDSAVAEAVAEIDISQLSGVLPVNKGGTGQATQADTNKAIIGGMNTGDSDVTDGTEFVSSYASDNGFSDSNAPNVPYKRSFLKVWNYIKSKIQSIALSPLHIAKGGSIYADGTKANYPIIKMKDNTSDVNGNGIVIGGGGATIIGGGESADTYYSGAGLSAGSETMVVANDGAIVFASNLQDNYASRKEMTMGTDGKLSNPQGFVGNISGSSGSCTGNSATSSKVVGNYTGSGGQQNPQYVGKNRVCFNMMNTSINGNTQYKDFMMMDCYSGFDVGGTVALGVSRQSMRVFAMRANAGTSPNRPTSWAESCEINTSSYTQVPTSQPSTLNNGAIWVV